MRNSCLNILLQSEPVRSPHEFETFPPLYKILCTGCSRAWYSAPKDTCGSAALPVLTDENTTGLPLYLLAAALYPTYSLPAISAVWCRVPLRSIHAVNTATIYRCSSAVSSRPGGMPCHLARHPRQQQAVACWAIKTGCPRIGVCRPSLGITAGARRVHMKSAA